MIPSRRGFPTSLPTNYREFSSAISNARYRVVMYETIPAIKPTLTMTQYLVATGAVLFSQDAKNPADAIERVKQRILRRGVEHKTNKKQVSEPHISMSLVDALENGKLNFIVMDETRSLLLAGLFNGTYEEPVSRELANSMRRMLSERLLKSTHVGK